MNVIGSRIAVTGSTDPTKVGRTGTVVLETMKTLVLSEGGRTVRIEKAGSTFRVEGLKAEVSGAELAGRLEDRWGAAKR